MHWGGFIDPHSGVVSYKIAIGTKPFLTDVIKWKHLGLKTGKCIFLYGEQGYMTLKLEGYFGKNQVLSNNEQNKFAGNKIVIAILMLQLVIKIQTHSLVNDELIGY